MSLVDEVMAAVMAVRAVPRLEHPQFIEGALYVTPDQWAALQREAHVQRPGLLPDSLHYGLAAVAGIPVVVLPPGERMRLPSGKWIVYSPVTNCFYTMPDAVFEFTYTPQRSFLREEFDQGPPPPSFREFFRGCSGA